MFACGIYRKEGKCFSFCCDIFLKKNNEAKSTMIQIRMVDLASDFEQTFKC